MRYDDGMIRGTRFPNVLRSGLDQEFELVPGGICAVRKVDDPDVVRRPREGNGVLYAP